MATKQRFDERDTNRPCQLAKNHQFLMLMQSEPPETQAIVRKYIRPLPEPLFGGKNIDE